MATFQQTDKDTIRKTTTIVEDIDLRPLKEELATLEAEKSPSDEELLSWAKAFHPHFQRDDRIKELNTVLDQYKEVK